MTSVLIEDNEKYEGKYVATESFKNERIISFGSDPVEVFKEAREKGIEEPVIFYVPKKDMVQIYYAD